MDSYSMHTGSAKYRKEFVVLALNRIDYKHHISRLHHLLDSMDSVCAFEIITLAAGDFIGLKGKLLSHTIIESAEINSMRSLDPLYDLGIYLHGKRRAYFLRQSVKG